MGTKYGNQMSASAREWLRSDNPRMSDHAAIDQWDDRMPNSAISPEAAYSMTDDVSHLCAMPAHATCWDSEIDRVAVYAGITDDGEKYTALFIIGDNDCIWTVYPIDMVTDNRLRAYLYAHVDIMGYHHE